MIHSKSAKIGFGGAAVAGGKVPLGVVRHTMWKVECYDKHGNLKWVDEFRLHQGQGGGADRLGKVVVKLGMDLVADAVHAILDGD